jgi:RNA polymerase sigma factor (sigma-70 family)
VTIGANLLGARVVIHTVRGFHKPGAASDASTHEDELAVWLEAGYPNAYRTALLILHDHQDAKDAVQEAFLRAWRFRAAVPAGREIKPWLYRVVVNASTARLRADRTREVWTEPLGLATERDAPGESRSGRSRSGRSRSGQSRACESTAAGTGFGSADPRASIAAGVIECAILGALADLPEHLRIVVVLRYYSRLSEREIAGAIHRRTGTVKNLLHEAKRRLADDPRLASLQAASVAPINGGLDA